jgi:AAA+ superfamily predicted ATPase
MVSRDELRQNASDLERELDWFARVLDTRFKLYFGQGSEFAAVLDVPPPELETSISPYAAFLRRYQLSRAERLAVVLSLVPHLRPQLLDVFFMRNQAFDRPFTEFGGVRSGPSSNFWPTGETLAFVLGGNDLETRFMLHDVFDPGHGAALDSVLRLDDGAGERPLLEAPLRLSHESLRWITTGQLRRPAPGEGFPAEAIRTELEWDDLVLHPSTLRQVREIQTWIDHGETLMRDWGMARKLRPGYRALFHGPPGTGKTMTACLLGKSSGREVYRIDLSLIVSKYIGETEKNLAKVFDRAQREGWVLFFDEADALFGKRSETKDAHDRYANQQTAYLLQRIESFDGIAILASNLRENLDDAFARRFETLIYFPLPRPEERLELWRRGFSPKALLDPALDLSAIAKEHALSGGSVMNVIRFVSLQALSQGGRAITVHDVMGGIHREFAKEGKLS